MPKKQLKGKVISDKMDKTIVVKVSTVKIHPRYRGRYIRDNNYKVHDENNQFKIGGDFTIEECRPISKDKAWKVKEILSQKEKKTEDKD